VAGAATLELRPAGASLELGPARAAIAPTLAAAQVEPRLAAAAGRLRLAGAAPHTVVLDEEMAMTLLGEIERQNLIHYPGTVPFPEIRRSSLNPLLRHVVFQGMHVLQNDDSVVGTPATLRNEYLEVGEKATMSGQDLPGPIGLASHRTTVSWLWDMENTSGTASGDAWVGVQLGTANALMPYPSAPTGPIAQLRWYPSPHSIKLYVARGDGSTPGTLINTNAEPAASFRFRLVSTPGVSVEGYMNGVKIAELTDPAKLPDFSRLSILAQAGQTVPRMAQSLWSGPGFGFFDPPGLTSWMGPITVVFA